MHHSPASFNISYSDIKFECPNLQLCYLFLYIIYTIGIVKNQNILIIPIKKSSKATDVGCLRQGHSSLSG